MMITILVFTIAGVLFWNEIIPYPFPESNLPPNLPKNTPEFIRELPEHKFLGLVSVSVGLTILFLRIAGAIFGFDYQDGMGAVALLILLNDQIPKLAKMITRKVAGATGND